MSPKVKICGISDSRMAACAIRLGAEFIGIVFARRSHRYVDPVAAVSIVAEIKRLGAHAVGVFEDAEPAEIVSIANDLGLTHVQLHGERSFFARKLLDPSICCLFAIGPQGRSPDGFDASRDFLLFDADKPGSGQAADYSSFRAPSCRYFLAGGLTAANVGPLARTHCPYGVDVSSGVENAAKSKDPAAIREFIRAARPGRYGQFGGCYVPELLVEPLAELRLGFETIGASAEFQGELKELLRNFAGRPTPITEAKNLARLLGGARIFLKREDLLHTGAHKINNAIGQCLLAKKMEKTRIIAETGAGQHGVATAAACALFGLECVVYMGETDIQRQAPNVARMKLFGADVRSVRAGSATLKEAVNEALRDWASNYESTHYCLGSALGPHPFPEMVASFQAVIGQEAKEQFFERIGKHPDAVVACVGGGSNAIGIFSAYLEEPSVELIGVEAGGEGPGKNAARFSEGSKGVLHGSYSYVLQNEEGQIRQTHSISAGLDYPSVGPQHADLFESKRVRYDSVCDQEALEAFLLLSKSEGIIPALESSHAIAFVIRAIEQFPKEGCILINLSGRGDKDLPALKQKGCFDEQV